VKKSTFLLSASVLYSIFYVLNSCSNRSQDQPAIPQYASLSDSAAYAGMNSCRQCHEEKYQSFMRTGMGMSFDAASKKKSSARYDHAPIYDHVKDFYYQPAWVGDSMYIREYRLNGSDTVYQRTERVSYIVGSGQHTNSHLMNVNGYVTQLPATFYTQQGKWDLPPGFENGYNSRFGRKIELECMSCHNAFPAMVMGSENKYEKIPNGIDCERCHGPGSEHVRKKQAGIVVDVAKEIDYSIVNPAKLPIDLQLDVCQRCHIQGNAVLKEGKSFYDFHPGMRLSEVMDVYMPVYKGDDDEHIMASHAERMKLSRCFTESIKRAEAVNPNKSALFPYKNAMTCVTCHNPHVSVKETGSDQFNIACESCHASAQDKAIHKNEVAGTSMSCSASIEARQAAGDNCISCHMPRNNTIDIPHVTTTDHYIRKPVERSEIKKIKEFVSLACINNPGADAVSRGTAFLNYFEKFEPNSYYLLDSAKHYFPDATPEDVRENFMHLVRWAYLKNNASLVTSYVRQMAGVLSLLSDKSFSNDDAWTSYRIGEAYVSLGDKENAVKFFMNAVELAPFNPDFRNKLAQAQFETGRYEEARKNLQAIIRENPRYASAYVSLGYLILSVDRDVRRADIFYDMALSFDPDNEQAMYNKAGTLMYLERKSLAIGMLKRLLRKNPDHTQGRALLNSLQNS
jgi:lipoprotein NlpI